MDIIISTAALLVSGIFLGKSSRIIIKEMIKNPIKFSRFNIKSDGNGGKDLTIYVKGKKPKVINV